MKNLLPNQQTRINKMGDNEFLNEIFRDKTIRQDGWRKWYEQKRARFVVDFEHFMFTTWPFKSILRWYYGDSGHTLILSMQVKLVLRKMRKKGFNPIYYTWFFFEHTFIFETSEEAMQAAAIFEPEQGKTTIQAWWLGLSEMRTNDWREIKPEHCIQVGTRKV